MKKLLLTLMNLKPKKRLVLNLPIWREKDGDNGMGRVASITHTLYDYFVVLGCNAVKKLDSDPCL